MTTKATEQQEIRDYLLGTLPNEQQTQLEERLLTHNDVYEELLIVEDELVDEYLSQDLSSTDRDKFESYFLAAPEHQEKLRFARAFARYLAAEESQPEVAKAGLSPTRPVSSSRWWGFLPIRKPLVGYALSAVLVVIVLGVTWLVWRNISAPERNPAQVVSVVLMPGMSRGAADRGNSITVAREAGTVRLQLVLPENRYSSFEATVMDIEGREMTAKTNLTSEHLNGRRIAVFDVPADHLPAGEYHVKLNGVDEQGRRENLAAYSFRVQVP